jgi:hypothetical protein
MVRVKVAPYLKRYMRKKVYHYQRYFLPLPKAIGDLLDTKIEYTVKLFGPAIVYLPIGLENLFSRLEKLEIAHRANTADRQEVLTAGMQENSRSGEKND